MSSSNSSSPSPLTAGDKLDILELYARYSRAEDEGDVEAFLATFAADGSIASSRDTFRGRDLLRQFFTGSVYMGAGRRHFTANHVITVDAGGALARANFMLIRTEGEPKLIVTGTYTDTLKKVDGVWRFSHRRIEVDPGTQAAGARAVEQ